MTRAALVFAMGLPLMGQSSNVRVFDASLEATWSGAVAVAQGAFLADRISNEGRRLRLRTGPLRAYTFDVVVQEESGGKTRVELVLRTNSAIAAVRKDALRNAERYFGLLRDRLTSWGRRDPR